jgi:hypothetical protein
MGCIFLSAIFLSECEDVGRSWLQEFEQELAPSSE